MIRVPPKDGLKRKSTACEDAGSVLARLAFSAPSTHFPKFVFHRSTHLHELRKVMGTSKPIDSSAAFLFEVPGSNSPLVVQELQIGGTSSTWPQGGSDFFNCIVMSDVSAETSGAILQAAIAINISMMARVSALTLAAR